MTAILSEEQLNKLCVVKEKEMLLFCELFEEWQKNNEPIFVNKEYQSKLEYLQRRNMVEIIDESEEFFSVIINENDANWEVCPIIKKGE